MIELTILNNKVLNNENQSLCSTCKGECCSVSAGNYHPIQVVDWLELLAENKLESLGITIQIGWYEDNNVSIYFLRPAHYDFWELELPMSNYNGCCVNLTENGCSLSFDSRPFICQTLEPIFNKNNKPDCKLPDYVHEDLKNDWSKYQHYFDSYFIAANSSLPFYP